jgi:hypothetical protein
VNDGWPTSFGLGGIDPAEFNESIDSLCRRAFNEVHQFSAIPGEWRGELLDVYVSCLL